MTVKIRRARIADRPALLRLAASFTMSNPTRSKLAVIPSSKSLKTLHEMLKSENYFVVVAELFGKVIAVTAYAIIPSLTHYAKSTIFMDLLVVAERHRRHGIGTILVKSALERARSAGAYKVLLVTREDNIPARALYRKCKFQSTGTALAFYI